jgi:hypothetical protein
MFMRGPLRDGTLECQRRGTGDRVRFDPRTNTFGVATAAGVMITFLIVQPLRSSRQTPREYFESQCK